MMASPERPAPRGSPRQRRPERFERPLRLRVRKIEGCFLEAIEAGTKQYEVTQTKYLGSAHGWTLGWNLRDETEGQLWVGFSPVGRQQPHGDFVVTHFACLDRCDVLDGVSCWADVARLRGSGVSRAQAAARDGSAKTQLDPAKPTFAWHFKPDSVHRLREPAVIEAFCGPWAETALRNLDFADMPADMFDAMSLSVVPTRISKKRAAAQQSQPTKRHDFHDFEPEPEQPEAAAAAPPTRQRQRQRQLQLAPVPDPSDVIIDLTAPRHDSSDASDSEPTTSWEEDDWAETQQELARWRHAPATSDDDENDGGESDGGELFSTPALEADYKRRNVLYRDWA